ncbi:MAG: hypothetical protein OEZ36_06150 [Spirochaetota bacterium]|nr:hypothetical protein [Spirochaetota bacterium]
MANDNEKEVSIKGSFTLAIIFLIWFIIIYFVQWFGLWDNWPIG